MAPSENTVMGTGVVSGFAYAPAAWTRERPIPPATTKTLAEEDRPAEV